MAGWQGFFGGGTPGQQTDASGNPVGSADAWTQALAGWDPGSNFLSGMQQQYGGQQTAGAGGGDGGGDGGGGTSGDAGSGTQSGGQQQGGVTGTIAKALDALNPLTSAQAAERQRQPQAAGEQPAAPAWFTPTDAQRASGHQLLTQAVQQQGYPQTAQPPVAQPQPAQPAPPPAQPDPNAPIPGARPGSLLDQMLRGPQAQASPTPTPATTPTPAQAAGGGYGLTADWGGTPAATPDPTTAVGPPPTRVTTTREPAPPTQPEQPTEPLSDPTPDKRYTSPAYGGSGGPQGDGRMPQNPAQMIGTLLEDFLFGGPIGLGAGLGQIAMQALGLGGGQQGGQGGNQIPRGYNAQNAPEWAKGYGPDTGVYRGTPRQPTVADRATERSPFVPSQISSGQNQGNPVRTAPASMPASVGTLPFTNAQADPFTRAAAGAGGQPYPSADQARAEQAGGAPVASGAQTAALNNVTTQIESGGNPNERTGSNLGLGQFSRDQWAKYGLNASNIGDPRAVNRAYAMERADHRPRIMRANGGREPTPAEYYISHQQGEAGGPALIAAARNAPNAPAWQVVRQFYPSAAVAQRAIAGNIPRTDPLARAGANATAGQFVQMWTNQVNRRMMAQQSNQGNLARLRNSNIQMQASPEEMRRLQGSSVPVPRPRPQQAAPRDTGDPQVDAASQNFNNRLREMGVTPPQLDTSMQFDEDFARNALGMSEAEIARRKAQASGARQ